MRNMKGLFFAFIIGAVAYAIFGKKLMGMISKKDSQTIDTIETSDEQFNDDNLTT